MMADFPVAMPEYFPMLKAQLPTRNPCHDARSKLERQLALGDRLSDQVAEDYGEDVLDSMIETEAKTLPDVESIDIQTEIQWYMRPYLLDFLLEAHLAFGLLPETLFLTVNILDRYCSKRVVYRRHYQLVGCTALWIAAKYGECPKKVPTLRQFASMCCSLYEDEMFLQMERHVMATLDWFVGGSTVDAFLNIALDGTPYDPEVEQLALYIAEISMFHREFVAQRPSNLARASLALARIVLGREQPSQYHWASGFEQATLVALSQQLHRPSEILSRKYRSEQRSFVADILHEFLVHHYTLAHQNAAEAARAAAAATSDKTHLSAVGPPTPPSNSPQSMQDVACAGLAPLATPQKPIFPHHVPDGCLTPPITPDIESFAGYKAMGLGPSRPACPETPMPRSSLAQQYQPHVVPAA